MGTMVDEVNLYARYEQRLLSGEASKPRVIPAVIITGFLGSGKTTLVQHVLRNRGSLRIAVLVNEVGRVDVDSELVNAKQSNAALGLSAADLSGGCICCSRSEDLAAALRRLRSPHSAAGPASTGGPGGAAGAAVAGGAAPCDYLVVETSGAADAGPLAEALVGAGFRLDAVVAVLDAEAGPEALKHPVALAQVCCADVVVLNKCDLVMAGPVPGSEGGGAGGGGGGGGLGALADLEDALAALAPGVRVVRARYGEVPLTTVLDVEPLDAAAATAAGCAHASAGGDGEGGGFMSHESVPSATAASGSGYRLTAGPLTAEGLAVGSSRHAKRRAPVPLPPNPAPHLRTAGSTPHPHSHHHHHHPQQHNQGQHQHDHDHLHLHLHEQNTGHQHHQQQEQQHAQQHVEGHSHGHDQPQIQPAHDHSPAAAQPRPQPHAHLHSGFFTESVVATGGRPCSLAAFAEFVLTRLVREPALLRCKGVLWFGERRRQRFTFHLSGRRRVELSQEGPWEGPPSCSLVLIGTDAVEMAALRTRFVEEVLGGEDDERPTTSLSAGGETGTATAAAGAVSGSGTGCVAVAGDAASAEVAEAVEVVAARIAGHDKLELLGPERPTLQPLGRVDGAAAVLHVGDAAALTHSAVTVRGGTDGGGGDGLVCFSTRGSALHGISGEDLNAELLRRANASGLLLLVAVTAPGAVSAVTGVQPRDRVVSLLLPVARQPSAAAAQAEALLAAAEPLLRKAYAHVHNCKCDVASAVQALR